MKKAEKGLIVLTLTTALLMGGSSLASMQSSQDQNQNRGGNSNTAMTQPSASDMEFANMAAKGGQAEIQMAQLALQKSQNKDVQKYANRMIKDHTKAGNDLDKIAAKKGMTLDKTPTAEQTQMLTDLQAASGADFDRMYIQMGGSAAHQKMEGLFSSEANNGTDPDLKKFAAKTLPVVQKHLAMAQDTMSKMSSGGMSGNMNGSMHGNGNMNHNMGGNMNGTMNGNSNRRGNSNSSNGNNSNR